MPSAVTHTAVGVAASIAFGPQNAPPHFWLLSVACSTIPDIDATGLLFGVPYRHFFGHRGFFHSFFFCALLAFFVSSLLLPDAVMFSRRWLVYLVFFFLVSAGHGILDMFTDGSLGVALLSPFDPGRYRSPWRPIVVSPMNVKSFFSYRGLTVMKNEMVWVWLPVSLVAFSSTVARLGAVKAWVRLYFH